MQILNVTVEYNKINSGTVTSKQITEAQATKKKRCNSLVLVKTCAFVSSFEQSLAKYCILIHSIFTPIINLYTHPPMYIHKYLKSDTLAHFEQQLCNTPLKLCAFYFLLFNQNNKDYCLIIEDRALLLTLHLNCRKQ